MKNKKSLINKAHFKTLHVTIKPIDIVTDVDVKPFKNIICYY